MVHESTVRVMTRQNQFRLEWRAPSPAVLRLEGSGMTFLRGHEPQDDSVLRGQPVLVIPWSDVVNIHFNNWWNSAIRVDLRLGRSELSRVWIQWLANSLSKPYKLEETAALYNVMRQFRENAVGPEVETYRAKTHGSV